MKALLRGSLASFLGSAVLLAAPVVLAEGEPCYNDDDCPGAECGGEVCNWSKSHPSPVGDKAFVCNPAGTQPKSTDGWCTTDANCKCKAQGATCKAPYCTFTKASDAPVGTAGTGAGGTSGTAGSSATAGTGTAGTGTMPPAAEESSGCSVASPVSKSGALALALGVLGLGAAFARRRR